MPNWQKFAREECRNGAQRVRWRQGDRQVNWSDIGLEGQKDGEILLAQLNDALNDVKHVG
jgi:hypothetical protein